MTREQKRAVKAALRAYRAQGDARRMNREAKLWRGAIEKTLEYYSAGEMAGRGELLRLRYIEGRREAEVVEALHIGRSTYMVWQADALSTVGVYAAAAGLLE